MINVREKGASGERELCKALNKIVLELLDKYHYVKPLQDVIQRNQNQSAVGGSDLSNTFGIGIEVKRCQDLAINQWWEQCIKQAQRNSEFPVLLYRQNNKPWRCVMYLWLQTSNGSAMQVRGEVDYGTFLAWFAYWVDHKLKIGEGPTV